MEQLISNSEFSIDENEVIDTVVIVVRNEKLMAKINNLSYDEYIKQIYGVSKETYYDNLYQEMEKQIKIALVVGALANQLNISVEIDKSNIEDSYNTLYHNVCNEVIKRLGDD